MIKHYRRLNAERAGADFDESGFTLIELLIVIVVLGILAATVIFALGGVTSQSAVAACNSDAKSYEIAASAYENEPANTTNASPTLTTDLTNGAYGKILQTKSANTHFSVALSGDGTAGLPGSPTAGTIYVGPVGGPLVDYNAETTANGCNAVK